MPRHRKKRGTSAQTVALVTCVEAYHHDEPGYAERGYHIAGEVRVARSPDGPPRLEWTGHAAERGPLRTPAVTIAADLAPGAPPVKRYRHGDAPPPWRVACTCGLDRQKPEADVIEIIAALLRKRPGRAAELPMRRL